jgi:hypothetical protein
MKSVAVDCRINFKDNNDGSYKCMALGDSIGDFAYHPDLQKDIQETEARFKAAEGKKEVEEVEEVVVKPKPKRIKYRGTEYYFTVKENSEGLPIGYLFYPVDSVELTNPIGFVMMNPKTGAPKGDILPVP